MRGRAQHLPDPHIGKHHVRGVTVPPGDDVATGDFRQRLAARRRRGHALRDGFDELRAGRQLADAGGAAVRIAHLAVRQLERRRIDRPPLRRTGQQYRPRRGGRPPQLRSHLRRRAAAECAGIVRHAVGVAHHQRDRRRRHAQLLRDRLRQRRADVLTDLDLTREDRDGAVLRDVQPRGDRVGGLLRRLVLPLPGPGQASPCDDQHDDPRAHRFHEAAPCQLEPVSRRFRQLEAIGLDRHHVAFLIHGSPPRPSAPRAVPPRPPANRYRTDTRCRPAPAGSRPRPAHAPGSAARPPPPPCRPCSSRTATHPRRETLPAPGAAVRPARVPRWSPPAARPRCRPA